MPTLCDRFRGVLLGLALGDAIGARFEGQSADWIARRFPRDESFFDAPGTTELWYTDDTQMAIGVAETLIECGEIDEAELCRAFVANYVPSRGYGRGARRILEAMEEGRDYREIAELAFPGGSYGNGAAMRVAPVGLFFRDDLDRVREQARRSAIPTHTHPLGIEGAQLLGIAVALCSKMESFDSGTLFGELLARASTTDFRQQVEAVSRVRSVDALARLGNGIEAIRSVPTALACFALFPDSYQRAVGHALLLGGDTDTIAAMTGALCGALLGIEAIPRNSLALLEDQGKGKTYITTLADRLLAKYLR
jgi:poly(ADP-ribose) glycohydrolase ARH3